MTNDELCKLLTGRDKNLLVPWYLMASWAYYWEDDPIISDKVFDELCRRLSANFNSIEHFHKHLVYKDWLEAGTCLLPKNAYPLRVRSAADHLRRYPGDTIEEPKKTEKVQVELF